MEKSDLIRQLMDNNYCSYDAQLFLSRLSVSAQWGYCSIDSNSQWFSNVSRKQQQRYCSWDQREERQL